MRMYYGIIGVLLLTSPALAMFECNECHSKNPAMVKMHQALKGQGCFGCHKPGERLMGKAKPKDRESLLQRRGADSLCTPCHQK